jgi:hypothetical protein
MENFMKKLILVLIILNGSFNAGAQVQFGVKAGLNIANFKTSGITYVNGTSLNSRTNFNAGVIASIPLFSNSFCNRSSVTQDKDKLVPPPTFFADSAI